MVLFSFVIFVIFFSSELELLQNDRQRLSNKSVSEKRDRTPETTCKYYNQAKKICQ